MIKKLFSISIILGLFFIVGCSGTNNGNENTKDNAEDEVVSIAEDFLDLFLDKEYDEAATYLDETMSEQLGTKGLQDTGTMLDQQLGTYVDSEYRETRDVDGYKVVLIDGTFEVTDVLFTISFNDENKVSGFYIQ